MFTQIYERICACRTVSLCETSTAVHERACCIISHAQVVSTDTAGMCALSSVLNYRGCYNRLSNTFLHILLSPNKYQFINFRHFKSDNLTFGHSSLTRYLQGIMQKIPTLKCLSIGTPKTINFPIVSNGKLMIFRCPNIQAHYNEAVIYLPVNSGTPKNNEFSIWSE